MTGTTIAHNQDIDTVARSHVASLRTQRRLRRNGRAKSQHLLQGSKRETEQNNQKQECAEATYHTSSSATWPARACRGRLRWVSVADYERGLRRIRLRNSRRRWPGRIRRGAISLFIGRRRISTLRVSWSYRSILVRSACRSICWRHWRLAIINLHLTSIHRLRYDSSAFSAETGIFGKVCSTEFTIAHCAFPLSSSFLLYHPRTTI